MTRDKYVPFNQFFNCFSTYRKKQYTDGNIEKTNIGTLAINESCGTTL